jgi:hypothetical protein
VLTTAGRIATGKGATMASSKIDVQVISHGSVFTFWPRSSRGEAFLAAHAPPDAQWWAGVALVVEHRYALDWAHELVDAGLSVASAGEEGFSWVH